jgi:hypothetical protein
MKIIKTKANVTSLKFLYLQDLTIKIIHKMITIISGNVQIQNDINKPYFFIYNFISHSQLEKVHLKASLALYLAEVIPNH